MPESLHQRLKRLREDHGFRTAAAFAKAIRMSEPTYRSYENGTRPLTVQAARQIAPKVGIDWKDLMLGSQHSDDDVAELEAKASRAASPLPAMKGEVAPAPTTSAFGLRDLPILGHVKGGTPDEALFLDNGIPTAFTYRPDDLSGVRDAYAVYVVGDSMAPRFKPGQLVFVNPSIPPRPGDDVVIQQTNHEVFIKEFVRRTEKVIRTKQYNPDQQIEYPIGTVSAVHVVVFSKHIRT